PTRAIQYRTPDTGGVLTTRSQPYVWLAEPTGQAGQYTVRSVDVGVGLSDGATTEITSGLKAGQQGGLAGGAYPQSGRRVAEARDTEGQNGPGSAATESAAGSDMQTASVTVTAQGFQPDNLRLKAGVPARITFTRTSDQTCATEVVFPDYGIRKALPRNQP